MLQANESGRRNIPAFKVRQWLDEWSNIKWDPSQHRSKPEPYCYVFSMSAADLSALSGVYQRTINEGPRREGIQRRLDSARTEEIRDFIKYGYPWSELSQQKRKSGRYDDLRKPGWLPTAIVINVLFLGQQRRKLEVASNDAIDIIDDGEGSVRIQLPAGFTGRGWQPEQLPPIEIIDGQHRLSAFVGSDMGSAFELPVVAFHGLDISWQAYLFWTINISPKRINPSLAFDLYPLLRTEDWLERFEGPTVYRETRAQELVEALWSYRGSPWFRRINMLGDSVSSGQAAVSQAAWIRALMATYIRAWEGRGVRQIGGLYGAPVGSDELVLPWSRAEQAAFLVLTWQAIADAVRKTDAAWAQALRNNPAQTDMWTHEEIDLAFAGKNSLLNTDQGVRGVLSVCNDLCFIWANELGLPELEGFGPKRDAAATDEGAVAESIKALSQYRHLVEFLEGIGDGLSKYDWRTAADDSLSDDERTVKLAFRGSGGYKELRRQLLKLLATEPGEIGSAASTLQGLLR